MPQLISDSELSEIQVAFSDLAGTFLKTPITYHLVGERLDRFMEDTLTQAVTNYAVKGLVVEEKSQNQSQIDIEKQGKYYPKQFYALLHWEELETVGLVSGGNLLMQADRDFLTIDNVKYEVIGITQVADLVTLKSFVKVMFRKNIKT